MSAAFAVIRRDERAKDDEAGETTGVLDERDAAGALRHFHLNKMFMAIVHERNGFP